MLRTMSSKSVLESRWLSVRKERVRLPSGHVIDDYYVAKTTDFAMIIALTANDEVILVREWRHGVKDYVFNLPAGGINPEETPAQTISRELLEETGYRVNDLSLLGSFVVSSSWLEDRAFLFLGRTATKVGDPKPEDSEDIRVRLVKLEEALYMTLSNQINDPYSALGILWAIQAGERSTK